VELASKEILLYTDRNGQCPYREWTSCVRDESVLARIRSRLARVRSGNLGDFKALGDGVFELRLSFGPGYRIYFGQHGRTLIILLCGGDKASQRRDIMKAKIYWRDYRTHTNEIA
jgi:putative addiction module killer protein